EGNKSDESDDESDEGSNDDSDETVKAGSGNDDDDNDDEDDDDNDEEEELAKNDEEDTETDKGGNEVSKSEGKSDEEETRQEEEEIFDPIPRTPKESEDESNDEEDQELRLRGEHASASTPSETATEGAGRSTIGSQSRQLSASESAFAKEPVQTTYQMEEPLYPPRRPPSPDRAWNKTLPAAQGDAQSWISDLARQTDARSSFNELFDTPIDFFNYIMHRLNVDTLTPDLLAGPTYELMRGSCTSLTELEYHLEEPLPLIPDNRGRRVIPFDHFINNDLEYLRGGASSRKYTTSVTKTKAADYGHIKWIEDLVPRAMWIQQPIDYNRHAL
nr:hypothetical protein [Tanacetum cinerariifolium]